MFTLRLQNKTQAQDSESQTHSRRLAGLRVQSRINMYVISIACKFYISSHTDMERKSQLTAMGCLQWELFR